MTNISPWWRHGGAMAPIEIDSIFPATETSIYGWDFPWLWINGTGRRWLERPVSVYNISVKVKRFPHLGMVVFEHKSYMPTHMHHIHPYLLFASAFEKQSESYQ